MEKNSQHSNELVSVVIPTYKRSDSLHTAIDSVLNQTYTPIEIIVVDDNGKNEYTKKTEESLLPYIEKNQITFIKHEVNKGGCFARNTGALNANGEYLSFLDDDDFYEIDKIEKQLHFLKQNSELSACLCAMFRIDENHKQISSKENFPRGITLKDAIWDGNFFTSMLMIKKEVFDQLEGFSDIPRFQDKYFIFKFLKNNYNVGILDEQLLTLVEHQSERISLTSSEKVVNALEILHNFEKENKNLFSKKEWKHIVHRFYYMKAYNQLSGGFFNRLKAMGNILNSIPYYTGQFNILKLFLRTLIP